MLNGPVNRGVGINETKGHAVKIQTSLRLAAIFISAAALGLGACTTSSRLVSQWKHPNYASPSFKRVMVGTGSGETAIRRNFEDEFVARLKETQIDAVPSYRYISEDRKIQEEELKEAAREAGADAAIIARAVGVRQETEYRQSEHSYPTYVIFPGPLGSPGAVYGVPSVTIYGAPTVSRYDVYTSEVTLLDVGKNEVIWAGTLQTDEPYDFAEATKNYVQTVIQALQENHLLGLRDPK
jgi:hypothetical protein